VEQLPVSEIMEFSPFKIEASSQGLEKDFSLISGG
jgi:hypothetical protein